MRIGCQLYLYNIIQRLGENILRHTAWQSKHETEEYTKLLSDSRKDNSVSPDLPQYIMETDNVRIALRKAKNLGMDDEDWMDVIKMIEEKENKEKKAKK